MISEKYETILHIGMQRTGSTFLQKEVFSNIEEINFIDRRNKIYEKLKNIEEISDKVIRNNLESEIERNLDLNKINLISEENINCRMWTTEDNRFDKIDKIQLLFPDAKIIFGTRDKTDLLVSWYKKYVICGGVKPFNEFKKNVINVDKINYDSYVKHLIGLYGERNVFVYKYESLKKDVDIFAERICDFMGVKKPNFDDISQNIGYSLWQLKISLLLNRFFKTPLNTSGVYPLDYEYHPHRKMFQSPLFPNFLRGKQVSIEELKKKKMFKSKKAQS